ncbi:MAG: IS110 family transposase [Gammaproteobacteria bacterium]|nr:IS110 family transposase [Gammaproteobacteria bacterium]
MSRYTHTLQVSVDTGCYRHHAAVGLSNGEYLGSFEFPHNKTDFADFLYKNRTV